MDSGQDKNFQNHPHASPPTTDGFLGTQPPLRAEMMHDLPPLKKALKPPTHKRPKNYKKFVLYLVTALFCLGLLLVVGWLVSQLRGSNETVADRTYQDTAMYTHSELKKGRNFTFAYPVEMSVQETSKKKVVLADEVPTQDQGRVGLAQYATASVSVVNTGGLLPNGQRLFVSRSAKNLKNSELFTRPSTSNVEVSDYEKQNKTYRATFSYTITVGEGEDQYSKDFVGQTMIVFGKKQTYIMSVQAEASVWQQNTAIWQQMLNSFQIDK